MTATNVKTMDVFPAIVFLAEPGSLSSYRDLPFLGDKPQKTRRVDRSRVMIIDGRFYIVQDSPEGPTVVFREGVSEYEKDAETKTHHILTTSGKIIVVGKDRNCGCGTRLRGWNPFKGITTSSEDPTE